MAKKERKAQADVACVEGQAVIVQVRMKGGKVSLQIDMTEDLAGIELLQLQKLTASPLPAGPLPVQVRISPAGLPLFPSAGTAPER